MNTTATTQSIVQDQPCGLLRRLLIMLYDAFPATAIVFLAGFAVLPLTGDKILLGRNPAYTLYVMMMIYLYFVVCWVRIGQTVGMRAWKVELVTNDGNRAGWRAASVRFAASFLSLAPLGLGYWSCLLRKDRACWHDRISRTRLRRCG